MSGIKMIITRAYDGHQAVVGTIEDWEGPVPQKGDVILYPSRSHGTEELFPSADVTGAVKAVYWGILEQPGAALAGESQQGFAGRAEPYVQVHL